MPLLLTNVDEFVMDKSGYLHGMSVADELIGVEPLDELVHEGAHVSRIGRHEMADVDLVATQLARLERVAVAEHASVQLEYVVEREVADGPIEQRLVHVAHSGVQAEHFLMFEHALAVDGHAILDYEARLLQIERVALDGVRVIDVHEVGLAFGPLQGATRRRYGVEALE